MSERAPTLAEMVRRHIAGAANEWHHCKVGVVTAVDTSTSPPRVSVKPLIKRRIPDTEDGSRQVESQGIVSNVPVHFMGAGGFRLTCPLSDGTLVINDTTIPATIGLIWFTDESLDRWLSGTGTEVDPQLDHLFSMNDGVFVPGLLPFGASLASWPQDHATLGFDSGPQIHLRGDVITIGDESTAKPIVRDGDTVTVTVSSADITALGMTAGSSPVTGTGGSLSGTVAGSATQGKVT